MIAGKKHIALHVSKNFKPRVWWTIDSQQLADQRRKASWIATLTFELQPEIDRSASHWFSIKGSLDYDEAAPRLPENFQMERFYMVCFAMRRGSFWANTTFDAQHAMDCRLQKYWVATLECDVQQVFFANHWAALRRATIITKDRQVVVEPKVAA